MSSSHDDLLSAKRLVWDFHEKLETCCVSEVQKILDEYVLDPATYVFRCVHPFRELRGTSAAAQFWKPLKQSFQRMQWRSDILIAGQNSVGSGLWVLSMGHFMGLFDTDWLGLRATRQLQTLRYAEFSEVSVTSKKVVQTGLFLDIVGLMQALGMNPLPPSTGVNFCYPGPRTHDGLHLKDNAPEKEGLQTQALVDRMIDDLSQQNHSFTFDPSILRRSWHENMTWYGPAGIGATSSIERYQEQHQLPFRAQLADKRFHGHQVRIAEGNYAAYFGWPMNLTNTNQGGFLGLPGGKPDAPMQVVDVYRREGEKLAENWVFIDLLHYLKHQGVDVLERTVRILNPKRPRPSEESEENEKVPVPKKGAGG
ncbi:unnamed protein product [Durusdinium trenchii]|uniref:Polyketide cyclase n=1 Tax=Durusdinium trenchii TaxID=1381693 RepID=A0ABP0I9F0_9DINO